MNEYNNFFVFCFDAVPGAGSYRIDFSHSGSVRAYYIFSYESAVARNLEWNSRGGGLLYYTLGDSEDFYDHKTRYNGGTLNWYDDVEEKYYVKLWDEDENSPLGDLWNFLYNVQADYSTFAAGVKVYIRACPSASGGNTNKKTCSKPSYAMMSFSMEPRNETPVDYPLVTT